jgi:hypothetical protein
MEASLDANDDRPRNRPQAGLNGGLRRFREVGDVLNLCMRQPEVDERVFFAVGVSAAHGQAVLPVVVARHHQMKGVAFRYQLVNAAILAANDIVELDRLFHAASPPSGSSRRMRDEFATEPQISFVEAKSLPVALTPLENAFLRD